MIAYLVLGWLATPAAAVLFVAGRRTWRRISIRRHTRRLIRDVQLYVHRPALRPLFDTHDQPRKERP